MMRRIIHVNDRKALRLRMAERCRFVSTLERSDGGWKPMVVAVRDTEEVSSC